MGKVLGKITDWSGITNIRGQEKAGREGRAAAEFQAGKQQDAVDFLSQRNELPSAMKSGATQQYGSLFGVGGGDQQQAMSNLQNSPIFQAIMSGQQQGEDAIMRNRSVTGLRSGNTAGALGRYNQDLNTQATMASLGGLQNLMGLQTYDMPIYEGMGGVGQTQAQGMMAESAGKLAGREQLRNFAQNERQYGHDVGMSFLGGSGGGFMGG